MSFTERFEKDKDKWESKGKEYINDKEKAKSLLEKAKTRAEKNKNGPISESWEKLQLLFQITKDWINGTYKEIPIGSIVMIFAGLAYFIAPLDFIPDPILGAGLIDDAAILGLVIRQVGGDLEKYKAWKSL